MTNKHAHNLRVPNHGRAQAGNGRDANCCNKPSLTQDLSATEYSTPFPLLVEVVEALEAPMEQFALLTRSWTKGVVEQSLAGHELRSVWCHTHHRCIHGLSSRLRFSPKTPKLTLHQHHQKDPLRLKGISKKE